MLSLCCIVAMFQTFGKVSDKYKAKYRLLSSNLADPNNPDLRGSILSNDILPPQLMSMSHQVCERMRMT